MNLLASVQNKLSKLMTKKNLLVVLAVVLAVAVMSLFTDLPQRVLSTVTGDVKSVASAAVEDLSAVGSAVGEELGLVKEDKKAEPKKSCGGKKLPLKVASNPSVGGVNAFDGSWDESASVSQ